MTSPSLRRLFQISILVVLIGLLFAFLPVNLFIFWDFRNNLWAPAFLLVTGRSPYVLSQIFDNSNAVWMPQIIGALFPLGWLSLSMASRVWFFISILTIGAIIFICYKPSKMTPIKLAMVMLLVFFFPPTITNISLGQYSFQAILLLLGAAFLSIPELISGLLISLAMAKPQLCLLVVPGILFHFYLTNGLKKAVLLVLSTTLWMILLLIPLFIGFPDWINGFKAAITSNPDWAQPSLLSTLTSTLGQPVGMVIWLVIFLAGITLSLYLWKNLPVRDAAAWSLALTCLVAPYIWSWDFVLLLPCFLHLLSTLKSKLSLVILVIAFITGSMLMWKMRWNTTVFDQLYAWVPVFFIMIFALCQFINIKRTNEQIFIENL